MRPVHRVAIVILVFVSAMGGCLLEMAIDDKFNHWGLVVLGLLIIFSMAIFAWWMTGEE